MDRYEYKPLDPSSRDIRLVTVLPGQFDDPIHIKISHVELVSPPDTTPKRPPLEDIRKTLPKTWDVYESLERRLVFRNLKDGYCTWNHPDPSIARDKYDPVVTEANNDQRLRMLQYEALSYTWGLTPFTKKVIVEEESDEGAPAPSATKGVRAALARLRTPKITITPSLDEALRYLRYADRPRTMWIDAISINQRDISERNAQVPRMGQIYRSASRVVAWLGPGSPSTKLALETLKYLGKQLVHTRTGYMLPLPGADEPTLCYSTEPLPFDDDTWDAVSRIDKIKYFMRVWIVQEVHLGNPATTLMKCGEDEILWSLFRRAIIYLNGRKENVPQHVRTGIQPAWFLCESQEKRINSLLPRHAWRTCKDSRDKVYGTMSLASPESVRAIKVDYSLPLMEVFKQVFLAYCEQEQRLQQLPYAGFNPSRIRERNVPRPSWLPYWWGSPRRTTYIFPYFLSSGISASRVRYVDSHRSPGKLEVAAVPVTTITKVDQRVKGGFEGLVELLRVASRVDEMRDERYPTGESFLDAYTWALFEGMLLGRQSNIGCPTVAQVHDYAFGPGGKDNISEWYKYHFLEAVKSNRPFRTSTGHLGMAREAQPGKVHRYPVIHNVTRS